MKCDLRVEVAFPNGSRPLTVHRPNLGDRRDLALAQHGCFLPITDVALFKPPPDAGRAGPVAPVEGANERKAGRKVIELAATNLRDRPVKAGSQYPFIKANAALRSNRDTAGGKRPDGPAGKEIDFDPSEARTGKLVGIAGKEVILGGIRRANGKVTAAGRRTAFRRVRVGFNHGRS